MGRKQRGITLMGFVIALIVVCFFGYMGMVLGPAYTEHYGVRKAMNYVAASKTPNSTDIDDMRAGLNRQFNVGFIESISGHDVKLIRDKKGNLLSVDYEVRKGFMYNIDFMVKFKYQVALGSTSAGD